MEGLINRINKSISYEKKTKKACMDYEFHMAISKWNEAVSQEIEIIMKEKVHSLGCHPQPTISKPPSSTTAPPAPAASRRMILTLLLIWVSMAALCSLLLPRSLRSIFSIFKRIVRYL
ncbi:uncharacterized protein LOC126662324 [Mercurialis annua]|uniref:uncharacterized protein LOC126662324 n=1 Tax=Mercurialis annua TaxID=3986 RepID=UPI002160E888|nr:uncharacterized protein LOC126662324 [Mercurialis annua]XP_055960017.1 uncharacterized protein LOC126662324 [Mercurialis annua]XP_055960018.1 uncharacterized protein LOC126662324 [Mercurialis annua]